VPWPGYTNKGHPYENRKNYIVIYSINRYGKMTIFSVVPTAFYTLAPSFQESIISSGEDAFGCCDGHSFTAFFTSSSDLIRHTRTASFRAQNKWKSLCAKSGEYGGWRNNAKFKSLICFTVRRAVGSRPLWRCRHEPEDNKPRRFVRVASFRWFRSKSLYYSLFIKLSETVTSYEFTVFFVLQLSVYF
jgi:hypothetical protein